MSNYYDPEPRWRSPIVVGIAAAVVAAIAASAITAWMIGNEAPTQVTQADIAAGAVGRDQIANGAVSADKIAANAITADNIPADSIDAERLMNEAVTSAKIAPGAVAAEQIKDGAITAAKIAPGVSKSLDQAIAKATKEADKALAEAGTAANAAANAYVPTVTIQSKNFSGSQGNVTCPSGAIAIAGGVTVNNESVNVVSSYPAGRNGAEPTGWAVMLSGSGGGQVYATCLK